MEEMLIKVLVQIDERNIIKAINSNVFIDDTTDWIQIDEGTGDKYAHAQNNYLDQALYDQQGRSNYVYENEIVRLISEEEKEVLFPHQPPQETVEEERDAMMLDLAYRLSIVELGGLYNV